MKLDFETRRARLSVGEFAAFSLGPAPLREHPGGRWRMAVGTQWHRTLEARVTAEVAQQLEVEAQFEVPLEGILRAGDWTLHLSGRLDQVLIRSGETIFREVKSVHRTLPVDESELWTDYSGYFAQLAIYLRLAEWVEDWRTHQVRGELIFVDIDEGISQVVLLEKDDAASIVEARKAVLLEFLNARADARQRRQSMTFKPPFATLREGQGETRERLQFLAARHRLIFFEAPTGYGKTGTLLEYGLERLREGLFDRVLYLTGKSTGQLQVATQLAGMLGPEAGVRFLQMRNRSEHTIADLPADYFDRRAQAARWDEARLQPGNLFAGPTLDLAAIKQLGKAHRIEPYAITRALLPHADIWIGDYNYAFAPRIRQVFNEVPGFSAERTLLIADEAHNLASRVAESLSARVEAGDTHAVAAQLQIRGWPPKFVRAVQNLAAFLDTLHSAEALDEQQHFEGSALLRAIAEPIASSPLPWEELDPFSLDWLWDLPAFARALESSYLDFLSWAPQKGMWAYTCLDAGPEIAPVLREFGQCVLMSATLQPIGALRPRLGLQIEAGDEAGVELEASAPWREGAYRVAIDSRVDTRYQAREHSYPVTARTIALATEGQAAPIAVFFSSYAYARKIEQILERTEPFLRVASAPRRLDLTGQRTFIEEALLSAHAIFLILGTGFTEGIDLLGGRISRALVIGPALPEVNAITRAALAAKRHKGRDAAFREVFQIPAMTKINQALGRLVRGPGHRAAVLLHGKRFIEPSYQQLLAPAYRTTTILRSTAEVARWWES